MYCCLLKILKNRAKCIVSDYYMVIKFYGLVFGDT